MNIKTYKKCQACELKEKRDIREAMIFLLDKYCTCVKTFDEAEQRYKCICPSCTRGRATSGEDDDG